jgi:hypothetical protein
MLSWPDLRQVQMPDLIGALLDPNSMAFLDNLRPLEQTKLNRRGVLRKQREVHPFAVPRSSQGIVTTLPCPHALLLPVNFMVTMEQRSV